MTTNSALVFILLPSVAMAVGFWPRFSVLKSNYPTYGEYTNRQMMELAGLGSNSVYGLASGPVRLSYALIGSGRDINIEEGECNWKSTLALVDGQVKNYIIHADIMRCWLEKNLGQPSVVSVNKLKYHGKKGIIIFEECPNFNTGKQIGRVDLWEDLDCLVGCLRCNSTVLFSLPEV